MKYDKDGNELPDPTPVALTVKQRMQLDRYELIKRQILSAIARDADLQHEESFEESQDFDVEDDDQPMTQYERAEIEAEDMRRTAAFVREREFVEQGRRHFEGPPVDPARHAGEGTRRPPKAKKGAPSVPPNSSPAKPAAGEGDDVSAE